MRWILPSLVAVGAGCAPPPAPAPAPPPVAVISPRLVEEPVTAVLVAALEADRKFQSVDSLWDPEATVVANGTLRYAPPRFAGIDAGGEVAITSSRLELRENLVWMYFEYRWISVKEGMARDGKATALLTPRTEGGWKIVHLHTSSVQ